VRIFPWAVALFIAIPIIEIYLLLQVGSLIGVLPTIALVILTAVVGVNLLRAQGFKTMARFQHEVSSGQLPAATMMEGAALLFGGALLLTPGFMTDTLGFLCLIPFTRKTLIYWLLKRVPIQAGFSMHSAPRQARGQTDEDIIEGEYESQEKSNDKPRLK
jgi:UPF0716 protein FxsA